MPSLSATQIAYQNYLASDHWKCLRAAKLWETENHCERCKRTNGLEVHHIVYRKNWYDATLHDLAVLCGYCHEWEHFNATKFCWVKKRKELTRKERHRRKLATKMFQLSWNSRNVNVQKFGH